MRIRARAARIAMALFFVCAMPLAACAGEPAQKPPTAGKDAQLEKEDHDASAGVVAEIRRQAKQVEPLASSPAVKEWLSAVAFLPPAPARTLYRNRKANLAYTEAEFNKLPDDQKAACTEQTFDGQFYYYTGYGTPLLYARALDVAAHAKPAKSFDNMRVFDFGYGAIGHLRMLAACGASAVGVEVQPVLQKLYSFPGDQGAVQGMEARSGLVQLVHGYWPGQLEVREAVGRRFDLIVSKNVLKRGYVHPERETDPRYLVHLGVDDETFVKRLFEALNPGGLVVIYNFSPAPAPPDKPYIPWADGRCPFDRDLLKKTGFKILAFDKNDNEAAYDLWFALDLNQGATRDELGKSLFAKYTILKKPEREKANPRVAP